jgi:hypothetical protein
MIIDKNGIIKIQNLGLVITPEFTINDLKNNQYSDSFSSFGKFKSDSNLFPLRDVVIDDMPFEAMLWFDVITKKIAEIRMSYLGFVGEKKSPWSPEEKILTKKKHDELLLTQNKGADTSITEYPWGVSIIKIEYPWGTISSLPGGDDRAQILIKYNN